MRAVRAFAHASLWVAILAGAPAPASGKGHESGFLNRTVTVAGQTYRYEIHVPRDYDPSKPWPVVLFLHGAGERGDDGYRQTNVGLGAAIRWNPERFPCIVVMPQCRPGKIWFAEMADLALATLDATAREFSVDRDRVYLVGLSMGGFGTWYVASRAPDRFAAIAPVCGFVDMRVFDPRMLKDVELPLISPEELGLGGGDPYESMARRIGSTPVWVFHGSADSVVPVEESRRMVAALRAAGGNVRYTEYPGVDHDSWTKAFAEPEFMPWLLSQRRLRSGHAK